MERGLVTASPEPDGREESGIRALCAVGHASQRGGMLGLSLLADNLPAPSTLASRPAGNGKVKAFAAAQGRFAVMSCLDGLHVCNTRPHRLACRACQWAVDVVKAPGTPTVCLMPRFGSQLEDGCGRHSACGSFQASSRPSSSGSMRAATGSTALAAQRMLPLPSGNVWTVPVSGRVGENLGSSALGTCGVIGRKPLPSPRT
jgi:hypothetical protein